MVDQALLIIGRSFAFCVEWFSSALGEADLIATYLAAIFLVLVSKFLLRPIFGAVIHGGASDRARSIRQKNKQNNKGG